MLLFETEARIEGSVCADTYFALHSQLTSVSQLLTPTGVFLFGKSVTLCGVGSTHQFLTRIRLSESFNINYTRALLNVAEILENSHWIRARYQLRDICATVLKSAVNAVFTTAQEANGLCLYCGSLW